MPGQGSYQAKIMFIDTSVSIAQDQSNNYFAGNSGNSLSKMITMVLGLQLEEVYMTHIVKCKPLANNTPSSSEINSCKPYLFQQIALIKPKVIVTLGPEAYKELSGDDQSFDHVRGHQSRLGDAILFPIYHPQFLLRNPSLKKGTLHDLQTIKSLL